MRLGDSKVVYHRVPELHPVLQQRFLANAFAAHGMMLPLLK